MTLARWKLEVTTGACALHLDLTYGTAGKLDIPILHNSNYDSNIEEGYCTLPRVHHRPTGNQCESQWRLSASPDCAVYMVDTWTLRGRATSPVPDRMLSSARSPAGDLLMLAVYRYWRGGTQRPDDKLEVCGRRSCRPSHSRRESVFRKVW